MDLGHLLYKHDYAMMNLSCFNPEVSLWKSESYVTF